MNVEDHLALGKIASDLALVQLANSAQIDLESDAGVQFRIFLSWPLAWTSTRCEIDAEVPVLYLMDGNALFHTATEAAWRRATKPNYQGGGIIVAIGHPMTGKVYDKERRGPSLTPPGIDIPGWGKADETLDFIQNKVMPLVPKLFPGNRIGRQAIYGHSFGGMFALHTLFTRPRMFDCYIASSPSIWWNDGQLHGEAESFFEENKHAIHKPRVLMYYGMLEHDPERWVGESDESFDKRKMEADRFATGKQCHEMCEKLEASGMLADVTLQPYPGEEHGSTLACSLSRGLVTFFEEWELP